MITTTLTITTTTATGAEPDIEGQVMKGDETDEKYEIKYGSRGNPINGFALLSG